MFIPIVFHGIYNIFFEEDGNKYAYIDPSTGRIKEEITGITVEQK